MSTLLATKVARVRSTAPVAGFTERDYKHLIHSCQESPRRAIRVIKAGEAAAYLEVYRSGDVDLGPDGAPTEAGIQRAADSLIDDDSDDDTSVLCVPAASKAKPSQLEAVMAGKLSLSQLAAQLSA